MPRDGFIQRLPPLATIAVVSIYLAVALPIGLYNTARRWRSAIATAGMPPAAMRARVFGQRYTAAIELIRRAIPEDEPYFLSGKADGSIIWARYDLLPRRAASLEALAANPRDCWFGQIRWSVVAPGAGRAPLLLERPVSVPPGCSPAPWRRVVRAMPARPVGPRR